MLVAGGLMWANMRAIPLKVEWPLMMGEPSKTYGWPAVVYVRLNRFDGVMWTLSNDPETDIGFKVAGIQYTGLAINSSLAIAALFMMAMMMEWSIRRRKRGIA